jgi:hypothetical protein
VVRIDVGSRRPPRHAAAHPQSWVSSPATASGTHMGPAVADLCRARAASADEDRGAVAGSVAVLAARPRPPRALALFRVPGDAGSVDEDARSSRTVPYVYTVTWHKASLGVEIVHWQPRGAQQVYGRPSQMPWGDLGAEFTRAPMLAPRTPRHCRRRACHWSRAARVIIDALVDVRSARYPAHLNYGKVATLARVKPAAGDSHARGGGGLEERGRRKPQPALDAADRV